MSGTSGVGNTATRVVLGLALAGAGFLAGFAYATTATAGPSDSATATDPALLATYSSAKRLESVLHEEIALLRRDLMARDRRAPRTASLDPAPVDVSPASAQEPVVPVSRPAPLPVAMSAPSGPPALPAMTPQGAKLYSDLLATVRNDADETKRVAALMSLASTFGPQANAALSKIADDTTQPAAVRDLAGKLGRPTAPR